MTHLLLVDGLNLVRKVYEAIPTPDSEKKAEDSIAVMQSSLMRALRETPSTHALGVFDFGGNTFRHRMYPAYKQDRKPMPEHLKNVMPHIRAMFEARGVPTCAPEDVEADDGLASAAIQGLAAGIDAITILSNDKDMCYLISSSISVRDHFARIYRTQEWALEKFGVPHSQLLDYLALVGDAVDGVPGVAGIGVKTARLLLSEYANLEAIYEQLTLVGVTPRIQGYLQQGKDMAFLSRELVTLRTDVVLGVDWWDMERNV
ncbi:MAG: 5'-3' exonuclease H3TH domain-containing protein [Agitococcus sp.]|nr:5'-3' exonuclease H3TH domain-containing protein [Agitococcus sp.]MDO9179208.1 5'-3' exonuclease H3TH domain-containing protein [Agitococcus sp.]